MKVIEGVLTDVKPEDLILLNENPYEFWKGVEKIGEKAFSRLPLTDIEIPSGITSIGDRAFNGCELLKTVKMGNTVIYIGNFAFEDCHRLRKIDLSSNLMHIRDAAFWNCIDLKAVRFPESLVSIGHFAFSGCESLKKVDLNRKCSDLGIAAFSQCENLKHFRSAHGLVEFKRSTFRDCKNLTDFYTVSVPRFANDTFKGCEKLKEIKIIDFDGCLVDKMDFDFAETDSKSIPPPAFAMFDDEKDSDDQGVEKDF